MKRLYCLFIIYPILISPIQLMAQTPQQTHFDSCVHTGSSTGQQVDDIRSALHQSIHSLESSTSTMPCLKTTPPSVTEMTEWLENWAKQDNQKDTPTAVNESEPFLKNENPKLIKLFRELTKNMNEPIQTECKNLMCVSQQIFGEKQGIQLLYMLARYGFNGSPFPWPSENGRDFWESNGLDNVLIGLSHLPENLFPIFYNKPLVRFKKGYNKSEYIQKYEGTDTCILANSFIEVFDCIYERGSKRQFVEAIIHEVAHVIGYEADLDRSTTWFNLSGWEETRIHKDNKIYVSYTLTNPECAVSEYGKTSPREDFAESAIHYRYYPNMLKEKCPGKYYYLKDFMFNGAEYLQQPICDEEISM